MKKSFLIYFLINFYLIFSNTTSASEPERTEFEQKFIGKTWRNESMRIYPLSSECRSIGGSVLQQDGNLITNDFICNDNRQLSTISEPTGSNPLMLVLDAFLLPKLKEGEQFMYTGECSLNGDTLTDFTALVRMGDRESVDWKTGVLQAWIPNAKTKKYEPLSTEHIVCETPTPP